MFVWYMVLVFEDGCDDEEEYIQNIKRGEEIEGGVSEAEIDMVIEAYEHIWRVDGDIHKRNQTTRNCNCYQNPTA